jgi:Tfp pilus assembly protein FimT
MKDRRAAFSLAELMMIVVFLGVFAYIAVPRFNLAVVSRYKAEGIAKKIATDLRLTRGLAISDAATNTKGFNLNMVGANPYGSYEIENDDTNVTVATHTIDSAVTVAGVNKFFKFQPLGNLQTGSDLQLTVSAEGKSFTITVISATGVVKYVEN